jgi:hypothetical protein
MVEVIQDVVGQENDKQPRVPHSDCPCAGDQRAQCLSRACGGVVRNEEGVWKMPAISFVDHRRGPFQNPCKEQKGREFNPTFRSPHGHTGTSKGSAGR